MNTETQNKELDFLTIEEVAERYRVTIRSVQNWMKNNPNFPKPLRFNRRMFRFRLSDLEEFEREN